MAQLFRPGADTWLRTALVLLVLLPFAGAALAYGLRVSPYATGQNVTVDQPVPFSHKHHVGDLGIDCRYCHVGVERSAVASLPTTETCMTCHSQIWTDAAVLEPVRASWRTKTPLRWARVHRLADYVYFDHSVHVAKGVGCSECHGAVHQMPLMRKAAPMTMGWCLDCHRDPGPHLRPEASIYDTAWTSADDPHATGGPGDRLATARAYLAHYRIDPSRLSDCTVCHR